MLIEAGFLQPEVYPVTAHLVAQWGHEVVNAPLRGRTQIVRSSDDLHQVGRLRYDFYIARDGKDYADADHSAKTFLQPVDMYSLNFFTRHNGSTVAACRLTRAIDAHLDPQMQSVLEHVEPSVDLAVTAFGSRMAIIETTAARVGFVHLVRDMHALGLMAGITTAFSYCRDELVPLFLKFGYALDAEIYDAAAGKLNIVRLDALDFDHFEKVQSPFAANRAFATHLKSKD